MLLDVKVKKKFNECHSTKKKTILYYFISKYVFFFLFQFSYMKRIHIWNHVSIYFHMKQNWLIKRWNLNNIYFVPWTQFHPPSFIYYNQKPLYLSSKKTIIFIFILISLMNKPKKKDTYFLFIFLTIWKAKNKKKLWRNINTCPLHIYFCATLFLKLLSDNGNHREECFSSKLNLLRHLHRVFLLPRRLVFLIYNIFFFFFINNL